MQSSGGVDDQRDFHARLSEKIHGNIVVPKKKKKKRSIAPAPVSAPAPSLTSVFKPDSKCAPTVLKETSVARNLGVTIKEALTDSDGRPLSQRLVDGTKEKNKILDNYEKLYGNGATGRSVVAKTKGKTTKPFIHTFPPNQSHFMSQPEMKQSFDKSYRVKVLDFYNILIPVMKMLTNHELCILRLVDKRLARAVSVVIELSSVNFLPLQEPRLNYRDEVEIDQHRVDMAGAAMVYYNNDSGMVVRMINGEYRGTGRDVKAILAAVRPYVSDSDYEHIKRILTQGTPARVNTEEPAELKYQTIARGNQLSYRKNPKLAMKSLVKEYKYSHLLPMDPIFVELSPYCRHTPQGIVDKNDGLTPRTVWDATTTKDPEDYVLNEVIDTELEAEITFGDVEKVFLRHLYLMRITYPDADIYIAMADVKACFRFPRIHADLAGCFGFVAVDVYCLATAMVFGSNCSASSWEPFRRAIEAMSRAFANKEGLVEKHREYLDMLSWDLSPPTEPFVQAMPCELNPGLAITEEEPMPNQAMMYVDDALMAAPGKEAMEKILAAVIEAIFSVMGPPDTAIRQCPLAMDKWQDMVVGTSNVALGLVFNSRRLSLGITPKYRAAALDLLDKTWHPGRRRFTVNEAQKLLGKLARLAKGAPWVFHMLSHMYTSVAYAISKNKEQLEATSKEFQKLTESIKTGNFNAKSFENQERCLRFALKKLSHMVHHCDIEYRINTTMRSEIEFFRERLREAPDTMWEAPIAHLIQRMPFATSYGDSCLEGAGGYCTPLRFWWHLEFPDEIVKQTLIHRKDNGDGELISINVLEYLTVIVNYCAAYTVFKTENVTEDPFPVLLNKTDNTSALNWTNHTCKKSMIGRRLARLFCWLLMDSNLGINSTWIGTKENEVADEISRVKKLAKSSHSSHNPLDWSFDYSSLKQRYPELRACRSFQLEPKLRSLLWDVVLNKRWPTLEEITTLKQSGLGKLTT